ncbi:hypothetical protein B0H34DRAFT_809937 [Crassisporium funariophilum]|nr:hypothetical protein B0H34DRAFT_809937 [Crassisporium funariophilum]
MQALRDSICDSPPGLPVQQSPPPLSEPTSTPTSRSPSVGPVGTLSTSRRSSFSLEPSTDKIAVLLPAIRTEHWLEDLSQVALDASWFFKLRKTDELALVKYTLLSIENQLIWHHGQGMKLLEVQSCMTAPDMVYTIPKSLETQIDHISFSVLMSPTLAYYITASKPNSALGLVQEILEDNPSWGINSEVKADKIKMNAIILRICNKLTNRRSEIKKAIMVSLGDENLEAIPDSNGCKLHLNSRNIFELCDDIQAIVKSAELPCTVELCGRVAFLRFVATMENGAQTYWEQVDKELKGTQEMDDKIKQSRLVAKLLKLDRQTYGNVNLNSLVSAATPNRPRT